MVKRIVLLAAAILALAAGSALAAGGHVQGPFRGTVHSTSTLSYVGGGTKTWTWDRGVITVLTPTSITLTRRDGDQPAFAIDAHTVVRNDGATYSLSQLRLGQVATVLTLDGGKTAAIIRRIRGYEAPDGNDPSAIDGPARGSLTGTVVATYVTGAQSAFQYDRGRVTSLAGDSLTLTREDGSTVTLAYDASLVVRHGALRLGAHGQFFSQNGKLAVVWLAHCRCR